jgi:hypothetical protein
MKLAFHHCVGHRGGNGFETRGYQVLQTRTHEINVKPIPATGTTWYPYPLPVVATNPRSHNYRPSTLMTKILDQTE